jgi:hypothetical protein
LTEQALQLLGVRGLEQVVLASGLPGPAAIVVPAVAAEADDDGSLLGLPPDLPGPRRPAAGRRRSRIASFQVPDPGLEKLLDVALGLVD